jgi:Tol biopolymer transport system component
MIKTSINKMLVILCFLLLFTPGCKWNKPRAPIEFPEEEIVYQKGAWKFSHEVGFINVDGSSKNSISIEINNDWGGLNGIKFPALSKDGSILAFRNKGNQIFNASTLLYVYQTSNVLRACENLAYGTYRPQFVYDGYALFVDRYNPPGGFAVIDPNSCKIIQLYERELFSLEPGSGSLSPDGSYIVYDDCCRGIDSPQISLLDLDTRQEKVLGEGAFPVWSPNGEQIAYIGVDGIYIYNKNSEEAHQIVNYRNPESTRTAAYRGAWPIMVSWSPEGDRLVYHKCLNDVKDITNNCDDIEEFALFVFDIESRQETKITNNGINPYWVK